MTHRDRGRGTLILEKQIRELGPTRAERRIKVASGTTNPNTLRRMKDMLRDLRELGRFDILRRLRDGRLAPMEVLAACRRQALGSLSNQEEAQSLDTAAAAFVAEHDCSEKHRVSLGQSFKAIKRQTRRRTSTVSDLPALLVRYRRQALGAGHARSFNLARTAALVFLRNTVPGGRDHRLYREVAEVRPLPYRRKPTHPQTPEQAKAIRDRLDPPWCDWWWSMCLTGMGPKEYTGEWEVMSDRVAIHGTKREARDRVVPRLGPIVAPVGQYGGLVAAFRRLREDTGWQVQPYDARRSFAGWLVEARVPRVRRKLYLGHELADVTDLYEQAEFDAYLGEDTARMVDYLGETKRQMGLAG